MHTVLDRFLHLLVILVKPNTGRQTRLEAAARHERRKAWPARRCWDCRKTLKPKKSLPITLLFSRSVFPWKCQNWTVSTVR